MRAARLSFLIQPYYCFLVLSTPFVQASSRVSRGRTLNEGFKGNFLRRSRIDGHSQKDQIFFFAHNIPFGKLLREKIVLVSSNLFYGRNFEKFEKCTSGVVSTLQNSRITS